MIRDEITTVVAGLRKLADDIESGHLPMPSLGRSVRRVAGLPLVPLAVHDALCGWRIASAQEDVDPHVLGCAGCGMAYLRKEVSQIIRS